jgi:DnaJ-class molecular chaperone
VNANTTKLTVQSDCADCGGAGVTFNPVCRRCGEGYTAEEGQAIIAAGGTMRCGDAAHNLVQEPKCATCDGAGRLYQEIPLSELAAMLKNL